MRSSWAAPRSVLQIIGAEPKYRSSFDGRIEAAIEHESCHGEHREPKSVRAKDFVPGSAAKWLQRRYVPCIMSKREEATDSDRLLALLHKLPCDVVYFGDVDGVTKAEAVGKKCKFGISYLGPLQSAV